MLPSNWAAQVLDPERQRTFEAILATPDDGLTRSHRVTQPARKSGSEVWRELALKHIGWFWAEHRADDFAGRARIARREYSFPARGRLL